MQKKLTSMHSVLRTIVVTTALASCLGLASNSYATDPVGFAGAGSSAAFNAMAFAAVGLGTSSGACQGSGVTGMNIWSKGSGTLAGHDTRSDNGVTPTDAAGSVWVTWDGDANGDNFQNVCVYLNIDSIVGLRLFFAQPQATYAITCPGTGNTITSGNIVPLLGAPGGIYDQPLPNSVCTVVNGHAINAAISDIRAEDGEYQTQRIFTTFGTTIQGYKGLGYCCATGTTNGNIGQSILTSFTSGKFAQPVEFNIAGFDPFNTSMAIPAWQTADLGGQVMMFLYNNQDTAAGGLGGGAFAGVDRFTLARVLNGSLTRTNDLIGGTTALPLSVLVREPLSGTYNTVEYQIPNSAEIKLQQDNYNPQVVPPNGSSNPLDVVATCKGTGCTPSGGTVQRVIGTGEMIKELGKAGTDTDLDGDKLNPDAVGYSFWSFGNAQPVAPNGSTCNGCVSYVQVDGADPLYASYSANPFGAGVLPNCGAPPCSSYPSIPFTHVIDGSYPVWNVLRIITYGRPNTLTQALINGSQTEVATVQDFVPIANMKAFRSHYTQCSDKGCTTTIKGVDGNGSLSLHESGGDVGGAVFLIQDDKNYYKDNKVELTGFKQ